MLNLIFSKLEGVNFIDKLFNSLLFLTAVDNKCPPVLKAVSNRPVPKSVNSLPWNYLVDLTDLFITSDIII